MFLIATATPIPKSSFGHWEANIPPTPLHVYVAFALLALLFCSSILLLVRHAILNKEKFSEAPARYKFAEILLIKISSLAFMIGFCETLINLYRTFIRVMSISCDLATIMGSFAEGMIFTILGLIVAIIASCAHIFVAHKNMRLTQKLKTDERSPE